MLTKYKFLFGIILGVWHTFTIELETKHSAIIQFGRVYPVTHVHKNVFFKGG